MADHPSHELFKLIQSLTVGEWKTLIDDVSKSSSSPIGRGKTPITVQLAQYLRKQKRFSDLEAKKNFGYDEKSPEKWRGLKRDCMQLVMRAIERTRSNQTRRAILQRIPTEIQKLIEKELWEKADRTAKRFIIEAEKLEQYEVLIQLANQRLFIVGYSYPTHVEDATASAIEAQRGRAYSMLQNIEHYQGLWFQLGQFAKKRNISGIRSIYDALNLSNPGISSRRARIIYYMILRRSTFLLKKVEVYERALIDGIEFCKPYISNPEEIEAFNLYLDNSFKKASIHLQNKDLSSAMALVHDFNDLLNIAGLSPFQKTVIRENVLMLRLMISRVSVTRTDYFEAIEEIEGFISTKRENISEDFLYRISFACTEGLLLFGELSLAAKWIVRIQKSKQSPFRPGISAAAWMMYFLIRYEQGAWDILRSQLSGGKAYLNKYEAGNEYYTALFSFFENAAKLNGNIGKKEFSSLHSTLHDLIEHPQYALLENYFYFSAWLVSKIQGLPFLSFMEDS